MHTPVFVVVTKDVLFAEGFEAALKGTGCAHRTALSIDDALGELDKWSGPAHLVLDRGCPGLDTATLRAFLASTPRAHLRVSTALDGDIELPGESDLPITGSMRKPVDPVLIQALAHALALPL